MNDTEKDNTVVRGGREAQLTTDIEALLFASGAPQKVEAIARLLSCSTHEVESALTLLEGRLKNTGMTLVRASAAVALTTSPEASTAVLALKKNVLEGEIGRAGLEVLAILIYRGPSSRSVIDYVRGVNSSATIRNLHARGLIERIRSEKDAREFVYRITVETLAHLGLRDVSEAPQFKAFRDNILSFEEGEGGKKDIEEKEENTSTV